MPPRYWLMKTEPHVYSIDDLARDGSTGWEGVRNYQARNFMRDQMQPGDRVLFYHSSCPAPGVVGVAKVSRSSHPDPTQFDPKSPCFDPKATKDQPRWFMAAITFELKFQTPVLLDQIKADPQLTAMRVVQRGQRLSVQPVEVEHFQRIHQLGRPTKKKTSSRSSKKK